jgi:LmbE family N-acetylglucosaminyl deacetylase
MIRSWIREQFRCFLYRRTKPLDLATLSRPAIIFSPHQDDETLACGGTIIKKKAANASIQIVYLTDGSNSHPEFSQHTTPDKLKQIRKKEALSAAEILGVPAQDIKFLDFRDGSLFQDYEEAIKRVAQILQNQQPDEIFIPYRHDQNPDHLATRDIVRASLRKLQKMVTVYEYPIWIWHLWPWTNPLLTKIGSHRQIITNHLRAGFGLRLLNDFRHSVYIEDVLNQKQAALAEHKTQMTRFVDDPNWLTLKDVSAGEWLVCFFQQIELFHRYNVREDGYK